MKKKRYNDRFVLCALSLRSARPVIRYLCWVYYSFSHSVIQSFFDDNLHFQLTSIYYRFLFSVVVSDTHLKVFENVSRNHVHTNPP